MKRAKIKSQKNDAQTLQSYIQGGSGQRADERRKDRESTGGGTGYRVPPGRDATERMEKDRLDGSP